ncbi:BamA/TamA family outer membrane protein [candidate division KSB1 bacterium]|nr:BamA/TamA family outer membrane protein [candidate division KSB1 bacterium]
MQAKNRIFRLVSPMTVLLVLISVAAGVQNVHAQFYFGRNKINYANFEWSVLPSDHFTIYFYKGAEWLAAMAQEIAEEAYSEYEIKFNLTIDRKIPLIIYCTPIHFQQTNVIPNLLPESIGGFFEYRKGRVVLPFSGNRKDFYHVVRHELVHVFTQFKISETARRIGLMKGVQFPLWFFEGLAEYWSIGYDTQADMFIRDAILHDYLLPLDSNELYFSGYLLYKEGQAFFKYYDEHYGEERIRRLMTDYWKYDSFEEAIGSVSGKPFRLIMEEWQFHLKKKYAKELYEQDISNVEKRRVTRREVQVSPALFASDSTEWIIYMSNRWGYENIIMGEWLKKEREILIRANKDPRYESLHILRTRLSVNSQGQLAFVAKSGGRDAIWIQNIFDHRVDKSISSTSLVSITSPMWSKSDDNLAFAAQDTSGQSDLYLWSSDSDKIYRLTDDMYGDSSPSFSPDGRYLVFSSDRGSDDYFVNDNLYIYELSTGTIFQLTSSPANEIKPFWHPSKINTIFYISDSSGTDNLWAIELSENALYEGAATKLSQLSDYYTGIDDAVPDPKADSSLILTHFSRYNYHLSCYKIDTPKLSYMRSITSFSPVKKKAVQTASHAGKATSYKLKYSLDFAQSYIAYDPIFGRLGGAQLGISDMLGNRYYNFLLANTSVTASGFNNYWNFAASMVDLKGRSNRALGIFHFANDWYSPYEGYLYERNIGVRGALNYPINVFNRLEFSTSMWHSRRDYFYELQDRFLIASFLSYVHDNSLWLSTGPIDGWRMRLSVGPSFDILSSQINNYTFLGDVRFYLRLGERVCLAHRTMGVINEGKNIYRFYIGGTWHMRGYRRTEIFGKKFILFNTELRFPIAQAIALHFREGAFGFAPVHGALFVDVGNAWDREFPGFIGSFGIGLRAPLMQALVLRLDISKRTDFKTVEKDTFVQFLFGWDY